MLTRVRYVGARMVNRATLVCAIAIVGAWLARVCTRLYVLARVPTWYQKKKAGSLIQQALVHYEIEVLLTRYAPSVRHNYIECD